MEPLLYFVVAFAMLGLMLAASALLGREDRRRIADAARATGWRAVEIRREPFAPGWFATRERRYRVQLEDQGGARRLVSCSTTLLTGASWRGPLAAAWRSTAPDAPSEREATRS